MNWNRFLIIIFQNELKVDIKQIEIRNEENKKNKFFDWMLKLFRSSSKSDDHNDTNNKDNYTNNDINNKNNNNNTNNNKSLRNTIKEFFTRKSSSSQQTQSTSDAQQTNISIKWNKDLPLFSSPFMISLSFSVFSHLMYNKTLN